MKKNFLICFLKFKLIYIFFSLFISLHCLQNETSHLSSINLVIKGPGNLNYLSNSFYLSPSEVIVNGQSNLSINKNFEFENGLNNVTIKFNEQIKSCEKMFSGLTGVIEIDLSNLDNSLVASMNSMFFGCAGLEKIIFGNINTSLVKSMNELFHQCKKLKSIDLSNFDTSSVTTLNSTFRYCEALTSVDVSNFNTHNVENMLDLFSNCYKLTSVDLSNFDISKVKNMRGIFYRNYELKYLNLQNFNTSSVSNFRGMFEDCTSLIYINLYSFIIKQNAETKSIFHNTPTYLKICINDLETQKVLESHGKKFNCSDKCFSNENNKIDLKQNLCVESCNESDYKYEYGKYCYEICPETTFISNKNEYLCLDKTKEDNYYYFDNNTKVFKECFNTCKECYGEGNETNNNCIECKPGFILLNDSDFKNNCYNICQNYFYFDENNKYICSESKECPAEYNKFIKQKNKCIDECYKDDMYRYEYNFTCYEKCPNWTNESNHICIDLVNDKETITYQNDLASYISYSYLKSSTYFSNQTNLDISSS